MSDLNKINSIFNAKIDSVKSKEDLQNIKTEFFGKNSYNKETGAPKAGHYHNPEVIELAKIVCEEMALPNVQFEFTGGKRGWIGDSPFVHLDTTKSKKYGWEPKVSIKEVFEKQ